MANDEMTVENLTKRVEGLEFSARAQALMHLSQSARSAYQSPAFEGNGRFGPGMPIMPIDPETRPRVYQYQPGVNLVYTPRAGYGLLDFATLRSLAAASKEIRLNVEKIKDTLAGLEWDIVVDDKTVEIGGEEYQATPDLSRVRRFWESPDGLHDFDAWLRMALEEVLVTDSLTLYQRYTPSGPQVEIIDGTTIRPLVDYYGRIPTPPDPAYLQILYGVPNSWYTRDLLMYMPRNSRVNTPYGESPIEWIIQSIVQSIKHDSARSRHFTEGNIPAAFAGLPASWTVTQIKEFDEWYNAIVSGDVSRLSRLMFIPHDGSGVPVAQFNTNDFESVGLDEWLMTVACWAFGNNPSEFGLTRGSGLGGSGYMDAGEAAQYRGMIASTTQYIKRVIDRVNRECLRAPWAKFRWIGLEPADDAQQQAQMDQIYMGTVYTPEYVANRMGIPQQYRVTATPAPEAVGTGTAYPEYAATVSAVPLPDSVMPYLKRAVEADLTVWRDKALRAVKKGWKQEPFTSEVLPEEMRRRLFETVKTAKDAESIADVFDAVLKQARGGDLAKIGIPLMDNPQQGVIDAASAELAAAIREYFAGLKQRVIDETTKG